MIYRPEFSVRAGSRGLPARNFRSIIAEGGGRDGRAEVIRRLDERRTEKIGFDVADSVSARHQRLAKEVQGRKQGEIKAIGVRPDAPLGSNGRTDAKNLMRLQGSDEGVMIVRRGGKKCERRVKKKNENEE